jgi:hypothetical protein
MVSGFEMAPAIKATDDDFVKIYDRQDKNFTRKLFSDV